MILRAATAHGRRPCLPAYILNCLTPFGDRQQHTAIHDTVRRQFSSPTTFPECRNKDVAPHIRSCVSRTKGITEDTGFHVWFLGTGGSLPSKDRLTSSTLLKLGGQAFLFDAGEGIQRQMMFTRQRPSEVIKVFITHMHADHVLGLPGLLLMAQTSARASSSTQVVEIYGPPGIYNYIASTIAATRAYFSCIQVIVYELVGGDADQECRRHLKKKSFIYDQYPELWSKAVVRKFIERNSDETWTIQKPSEQVRDDAYDIDRGDSRPMLIHAAEVKHNKRVQTFGYTVQEPEPSRKIDAEKATKLGVSPGRKYRKLKNGFPVMSDDGIREVRPEEVLAGAVRKARKFACIGDNCGLTPAMIELCMDADVLVHEATESVKNAAVRLFLWFVFLCLFCAMFCSYLTLAIIKGCSRKRSCVSRNGWKRRKTSQSTSFGHEPHWRRRRSK